MKKRMFGPLIAVVLGALGLGAQTGNAATVILDSAKKLVGLDGVIFNLSAGNVAYDARFVSGTCEDAYGNCAEANFPFLSVIGGAGVDARDASQFLAAAMPGDYKNDASRIKGCTGTTCLLLTAAGIGNLTSGPGIDYGSFRAGDSTAINNGAVPCGFNTASGVGLPSALWVVWTPQSSNNLQGTASNDGIVECPGSGGGGGGVNVVPVPASLPLLSVGLIVLGSITRRKRKIS